jgi:hypothetical protein
MEKLFQARKRLRDALLGIGGGRVFSASEVGIFQAVSYRLAPDQGWQTIFPNVPPRVGEGAGIIPAVRRWFKEPFEKRFGKNSYRPVGAPLIEEILLGFSSVPFGAALVMSLAGVDPALIHFVFWPLYGAMSLLFVWLHPAGARAPPLQIKAASLFFTFVFLSLIPNLPFALTMGFAANLATHIFRNSVRSDRDETLLLIRETKAKWSEFAEQDPTVQHERDRVMQSLGDIAETVSDIYASPELKPYRKRIVDEIILPLLERDIRSIHFILVSSLWRRFADDFRRIRSYVHGSGTDKKYLKIHAKMVLRDARRIQSKWPEAANFFYLKMGEILVLCFWFLKTYFVQSRYFPYSLD